MPTGKREGGKFIYRHADDSLIWELCGFIVYTSVNNKKQMRKKKRFNFCKNKNICLKKIIFDVENILFYLRIFDKILVDI